MVICTCINDEPKIVTVNIHPPPCSNGICKSNGSIVKFDINFSVPSKAILKRRYRLFLGLKSGELSLNLGTHLSENITPEAVLRTEVKVNQNDELMRKRSIGNTGLNLTKITSKGVNRHKKTIPQVSASGTRSNLKWYFKVSENNEFLRGQPDKRISVGIISKKGNPCDYHYEFNTVNNDWMYKVDTPSDISISTRLIIRIISNLEVRRIINKHLNKPLSEGEWNCSKK